MDLVRGRPLVVAAETLGEKLGVMVREPVDRKVVLDRGEEERNTLVPKILVQAAVDLAEEMEQLFLADLLPRPLAMENGAANILALEDAIGIRHAEHVPEALRKASQIHRAGAEGASLVQGDRVLADREDQVTPVRPEESKERLGVIGLGNHDQLGHRHREPVGRGAGLRAKEREAVQRVLPVPLALQLPERLQEGLRVAALVLRAEKLLRPLEKRAKANRILLRFGMPPVGRKVDRQMGAFSVREQVRQCFGAKGPDHDFVLDHTLSSSASEARGGLPQRRFMKVSERAAGARAPR